MSRSEAANIIYDPPMEHIRQTLVHLLEATPNGCPVSEVIAALARRHALSRASTHQILRRLVMEDVIEYRHHCGQTCMALSFHGARRVATRFIILPPGVNGSCMPPGDLLPLVIDDGAAFGDGRHPTTRLALRGIEELLGGIWLEGKPPGAKCLDIGTGSGILAIAAVRLGAASVVALDVDPCAVAAARHNAALNGISSQCAVVQKKLDLIEEDFDVVLANLRPPTLVQMAPWVGRHLRTGGSAILSGFRPEEAASVAAAFAANGIPRCWQAEDAGWSALAMRKPPLVNETFLV